MQGLRGAGVDVGGGNTSSQNGNKRYDDIASRLRALEEEKAMLEMAMRRMHMGADAGGGGGAVVGGGGGGDAPPPLDSIHPRDEDTAVSSNGMDAAETTSGSISLISDNAYAAGVKTIKNNKQKRGSITGMKLTVGGSGEGGLRADFNSSFNTELASAWGANPDLFEESPPAVPVVTEALHSSNSTLDATGSMVSDNAYAAGRANLHAKNSRQYQQRQQQRNNYVDSGASITGMRLTIPEGAEGHLIEHDPDVLSTFGDNTIAGSAWGGVTTVTNRNQMGDGDGTFVSDYAYASGKRNPANNNQMKSSMKYTTRSSASDTRSITGMKVTIQPSSADVQSVLGDSCVASAWGGGEHKTDSSASTFDASGTLMSEKAYASGKRDKNDKKAPYNFQRVSSSASKSITGMNVTVPLDGQDMDAYSQFGDSCVESAWAGIVRKQPGDGSTLNATTSIRSDNAYANNAGSSIKRGMHHRRTSFSKSRAADSRSITGMNVMLGGVAEDVQSCLESTWGGASGYWGPDARSYSGSSAMMSLGETGDGTESGYQYSEFTDDIVVQAGGGGIPLKHINRIKLPKGKSPRDLFRDNDSEILMGATDVVEYDTKTTSSRSITSREDDSILNASRPPPAEIQWGADKSVCTNYSDIGSISLAPAGGSGAMRRRKKPSNRSVGGGDYLDRSSRSQRSQRSSRSRRNLEVQNNANVGGLLYRNTSNDDDEDFARKQQEKEMIELAMELSQSQLGVESQAVGSQQHYFDFGDTASVMGLPKEIDCDPLDVSCNSNISDLESISVKPAPRATSHVRRKQTDDLQGPRMYHQQQHATPYHAKLRKEEAETSDDVSKKEQELLEYAMELSLKESKATAEKEGLSEAAAEAKARASAVSTGDEDQDELLRQMQEQELIELAMERSLQEGKGAQPSIPNDESVIAYQKNARDLERPSAIGEITMTRPGSGRGYGRKDNLQADDSSASSVTFTDINTEAPVLPASRVGMGSISPSKKKQRSRLPMPTTSGAMNSHYAGGDAKIAEQEEEMLRIAIERSLKDDASAASSITSCESRRNHNFMFETATCVSGVSNLRGGRLKRRSSTKKK